MATHTNFTSMLRPIAIIGKLSLAIILLAGFLAGCTSSRLEADYGSSFTYNTTVQIARPEADLDTSPATGLSAAAGDKVMEAYNKSFERKVQQSAPYATFLNMGVSQ